MQRHIRSTSNQSSEACAVAQYPQQKLAWMSCHTYKWDMSHTWISHATRMNDMCHQHRLLRTNKRGAERYTFTSISLQHSATLCNTLQHTATHCSSLQRTATHCNIQQHTFLNVSSQHSATLCNPLQHTATHCSSLQHTATHCNTLQHTATHILKRQLATKSTTQRHYISESLYTTSSL